MHTNIIMLYEWGFCYNMKYVVNKIKSVRQQQLYRDKIKIIVQTIF